MCIMRYNLHFENVMSAPLYEYNAVDCIYFEFALVRIVMRRGCKVRMLAGETLVIH